MQSGEFIEATGRLEQYYDKEYTNEQRQIMYDELKDIEIERYKRLISIVIRKSKFLPKVADIIDANNEEPYTKYADKQEKIECKKCNSTGYIIYNKVIQDGNKKYTVPYGALCDCRNARQYKGWEITDKRYRSNFYTPYAKELNLVN